MRQTGEKENWLNWACRLVIVFDVYLIISGYLAWYQVKRQLISPLIPRETIDQIIGDSQFFEASITAAIFFLAGILCYTFNKKIMALVCLGLAAIAHEVITRYLIF